MLIYDGLHYDALALAGTLAPFQSIMVCTYPTKNLASALCLAFLCKLAELFFFLRLHVAGSVASSLPL